MMMTSLNNWSTSVVCNVCHCMVFANVLFLNVLLVICLPWTGLSLRAPLFGPIRVKNTWNDQKKKTP